MKVIVSAFSNLYTDQRIEKICRTLHDGGYAVRLFGNNWGNDTPLDRPYPCHRISLDTNNLRMAYVAFNWKLYHILMKSEDAQTILYSNDLDSLLPNYLISKKLNIPLVYDSHEIFTEMPSVNGRWTQKIWRFLERQLIPNLSYMITSSDSYADWYERNYRIPRPLVVHNYPVKRTPHFAEKNTDKKIILYQGAINPSRGLDKIIPVIKRFENTELWIAGDGPKKNEYMALAKSLNLEDKVIFLGSIAPRQLRELTPIADVGISIEENNGLSYYYSTPNKISDYIQARIPVVTSDFPEMKRIVTAYGVGETIGNHSEEELFMKISTVLSKGKSYYQPQLERASQDLIWENEKTKLLQLFKQIK